MNMFAIEFFDELRIAGIISTYFKISGLIFFLSNSDIP
jgi:hypothetical protein